MGNVAQRIATFLGRQSLISLSLGNDGIQMLAERVGFEPTVRFPAHTLSKRAP